MKVVFFCLLAFCSIKVIAVKAQANHPVTIPPSPEAAALGKYGDWPVSYNTGTPDISIPLYSVEVQDIVVPVSLSYHASGIKVAEMPSWVGQGWSLKAGGSISRVMRGRPDESKIGQAIEVINMKDNNSSLR